MMETMIPPQVGMRLWPLFKKRGQGAHQIKNREGQTKKEKGQIRKRGRKKMREEERRDNATILLPHLCFKVAP